MSRRFPRRRIIFRAIPACAGRASQEKRRGFDIVAAVAQSPKQTVRASGRRGLRAPRCGRTPGRERARADRIACRRSKRRSACRSWFAERPSARSRLASTGGV